MKIWMLGMLMGIAGLIQAQNEDALKYGVAGDEVPKGLSVGTQAPDIQLVDQNGSRFHLRESLQQGPVVLTFYRGNWCPHCSLYLAELSSALDDIEDREGTVVAISPEKESELVRTGKEKANGRLILLSDPDNKVMEAYDVAYEVSDDYQARLDKNLHTDVKEHNAQEVAVLPVAATYIINKDGEIVYRHFDLDYSKRAPIKEILETLEDMN